MKAAFVLNFIRYTDWPEGSLGAPDSPIVACVIGEPGSAALAGIEGKTTKGRAVQIRAVASAEEARACHALFVAEPDPRRFVGTLRLLQRTPVLTIGDAEGFIDAGGMIGLVHLENRLQFEVNLGAVQQAQLKASSVLLRLARNVIAARPQ
ncbi:MAG TPA: YfiR family protein [Rhodocyclaceae bacterium]